MWQNSIPLPLKTHAFLRTDSSLECGEPLELDELIVQEAILASGIIGQIDKNLAPDIYKAILSARFVSKSNKELVRVALGC